MSVVAAKPSMSGMLRSIRIRSKRSAAARATASVPFFTQTLVQPSAAEIALGDGGVHCFVFYEQDVALQQRGSCALGAARVSDVRDFEAQWQIASASWSAIRCTGFEDDALFVDEQAQVEAVWLRRP